MRSSIRRLGVILFFILLLFLSAGLILLGSRQEVQDKKSDVVPTATPSATISPNNNSVIPRGFGVTQTPQFVIPQQQNQGQPNQQQVQEIHNDGTSSQQQSPAQPTPQPQPTKICLPVVGCLQ